MTTFRPTTAAPNHADLVCKMRRAGPSEPDVATKSGTEGAILDSGELAQVAITK
jgi:hypothetical protein